VIACPDRVRAAFAPAGHSFAPAQTLSPLGTVTDDEFTVAAALSDEGRRLVAWKTAGIDAGRPDSLLAAMGDPSPEPPVAGDHTAPRVSIAVTRAALAEAASGEPLVARITCSEPCAVVAGVFPSGYVNDYTTAVAGLRVAVLPAGSNPTTWHLDPAQARIAHTLVMDPGATVDVVAVDSAGNIGLAQSSLERQANARP